MKLSICFLTLIAIAFTMFASPTMSQEDASRSPAQHAATIDELLTKYQEYGQLNGAVLVAEEGKVILRKGYGMANMEWEIPIEANTKFRIGSVTKQFTAAVVLLLVEEGKIKLDDPITKHLEDYRKDTGDKITIHHLLCHTSGIPSYTNADFFANHSRTAYEIEDFIPKFASGDLEFEPGSEYRYNNSAYYLLGAIIEKAAGKPYREVLQTRIFDPLEMNDSGYDETTPIIKRRAQGYQKTPEGYVNADFLDMDTPYAAGSLYSTVDDLFKWDQALHNNTILSAESLKLMQTPNLENYGYGVSIADARIGDQKLKLVQHGGGINGFNCQFTRFVDRKHVFIVLDNVEQANFFRAIEQNVVAILEDRSFEQPQRSIYDEIASLAFENGAEAAVAKYRSLKESNPDDFDFPNEEALNRLGYEFMGRDRTKDAIEVFKLNVEMFPEAFNPYDSLGEAYLKAGNQELGIANYKKSVEINPENLGAVQILKKLEGNELVVGPEILESYIGKYKAEGMTVAMSVEGGKLIAKPQGQSPATLEPVSETEFVVSQIKARVEFTKSDDGKVTGLILKMGDRKLEAKKVE